jgi:ATP synthase protein I
MSSSVFRAARMQAFWLVCLPAALVIIFAFLLWTIKGTVVAYSAMLGGAVWLIPNIYFAWRIFSKVGAAHILLWRFYRAEIAKLILSGFLFIFIVDNFTVHVPAFLIGFALTQLTFWVAVPALFIFKKR